MMRFNLCISAALVLSACLGACTESGTKTETVADSPASLNVVESSEGGISTDPSPVQSRQPQFIETVNPLPIQTVSATRFELSDAELRRPANNEVSTTIAVDQDRPVELFRHVSDIARDRATQAYEPPVTPPRFVRDLDYDEYRYINFREENALFSDTVGNFRVMADARGSLFLTPVTLNVVGESGLQEVPYDPASFDFHPLNLTEEQKSILGLAGFRLLAPLNRSGQFDEVMSVKGASFFRGLGADNQYGASARGISVRTASPDGEEFPVFREFWIQQPESSDDVFVFHALLDGPSITGAYEFRVRPGVQTQMDVRAVIYARKDTDQIGLSPLTSMFEFAPHDPLTNSTDFRPRVHDSEGLSMLLQNGEWIWRPLTNPQKLQVSSFADRVPQGFGLMQRNRDFEAYQDIEAGYETRPSVWVTPGEGWDSGRLTLVEIPTPNEYNDNVIAYWQMAETLKKGEHMEFTYSLDWGRDAPLRSPKAEVHSTRTGVAEATGRRLFIVDFDVADASKSEDLVPDIWSSSGSAQNIALTPDLRNNRVRLSFELDASGNTPAELRAVLKRVNQPVSETWLYRWTPAG